jgi:hypothetical protein
VQSAGEESLGSDAWRFIKVLLLFHEVGIAFQRGAQSLADVVAILEEQELYGRNNHDLRCSPASVSRHLKVVRRYFGRVFGTDELAPLLKDNGPGNAVDGLTPLGMRAWELIHRLLVLHQMAEEND